MEESSANGTLLSHMVYFTLKDKSSDSIQKMISACQKYLSGHPGTVFFAAGTLVEDLSRPVNDKAFDVALHVVFASREDHDRYQTAEEHLQFIEENKSNWEMVRVFDANVTT